MKELTSANIGSADFMTKDNSGNIYYIESGCIYKLNTSNGSKNKFMDLSDLFLQKTEKQDVEVEEQVTEMVETGKYKEVEETIEEEVEEIVDEEVTETVIDEETGEEKQVIKTVQKSVSKTVPKTIIKKVPITMEETKTVTKTIKKDVVIAKYSDYSVCTLVYDLSSNKLYLSGYYKTLTKPYNQPESVTYNVIYDITSGSENVIFEKDLSRNAEPKPHTYATTVNSSTIRIASTGYNITEYDFNINTGDLNSIDYVWSPEFWIKYANSIYRVNGTSLQRYNISSREYENLSSDIQGRLAYTKDSVYWYSDDIFHKLTLSDGVVKNLPISLDEANVEYEENAALRGGFDFFVIDDETIIFYDSYMQSFRKLQKNK